MAIKISPVTGHYVDVTVGDEEFEVFYLENGQGIPILCQHTAGCDNRQWRNFLRDPEVTKDFRVIAYDLPRHGKSEPPKNKEWWKEQYDLTSKFFTSFIVALADALELDRPIFMGSSFGGVVCLYLAREYPDRFRALIALEAAEYTPGYYLDWWRHPEVDSRDLTASVVIGLMAPHPLTNERDRRLTTWYYAQGGPGVLKGDLYFYSVEHDMRETAKDIPGKVPLYMLTGEYDYLSTPEQTLATASKIKGAKATTMYEIGHFPMSENHQTFMKYLQPVLQEINQAG